MFDEILLETDEEVTSAIEKIKKSKSSNVALVLPRNAVLGQSIVNLKLVFRQAAEMDKTVAIVSPDRVTRNLADRVGFAVSEVASAVDFPDLPAVKPTKSDDQASKTEKPVEPAPVEIAKKRFDNKKTEPTNKETEEEPEDSSTGDDELDDKESSAESSDPDVDIDESGDFEKPAERVAAATTSASTSAPHRTGGGMIPTRGNLRMYRNQKKRPMLIISAVLVGIGIAGLALAAVIVPSAKVTITVEAQPFSDRVTSTVSTEATALDVEKGVLPGKLQTVTLDTKVSAKATGKKDQGTNASGTVTILNAWDSLPHTFPAGTTVTAKNGNQYTTKTEVTVGGATSTISNGTSVIIPGQKEVAVVAAAPGDSYNVGATSFTIPSLPKAQQEKIYATSSAAISGGTSKIVGVVTADDIAKLTDAAKLQNKTEATAKLKTDLKEEVVVEKAIQTASQDVKSSAAADAVADSVEVTVTGKFGVITFKANDQKELVQKLVSTKIPQGQTLVTSGDGIDIDTSQFEVNLVTDVKIELINNIKAFTVNGFDENQIRRLLVGVKPTNDAVVAIVKTKIPAQKAEMSVTPSWWPRLPLWSEKIKLELKYAGKESS